MRMARKTLAEQTRETLDRLISEFNVRSKIDKEGLHHIRFFLPGRRPRLKEWWVVRYVLEHYKHLGFEGAKGASDGQSFARGPDLRVKHRRKWQQAEVEI